MLLPDSIAFAIVLLSEDAMQLLEYIKPLSKTELQSLAARCKTSAGQIKQVASGHRRCGESLAINLERETFGVVTCEELRPDVDWAYLRATDPKPEDTAAA